MRSGLAFVTYANGAALDELTTRVIRRHALGAQQRVSTIQSYDTSFGARQGELSQVCFVGNLRADLVEELGLGGIATGEMGLTTNESTVPSYSRIISTCASTLVSQ